MGNNILITLVMKYLTGLVILCNFFLLGYYYHCRNAFHVDEFWSYAHANTTHGPYVLEQNVPYQYTWYGKDSFVHYLTVQEEDKYNYKAIMDNLKIVEHPPLYFVLLHTICALFPNQFSKWFGGGLNLFLFPILWYVLYQLFQLVLKDKKMALGAAILWGFSNAAMAMGIYIRMYLLQALWFYLLLLDTFKFAANSNLSFKRLGLIFLWSLLGMLTHYYSGLLAFVVAAVMCMVLLLKPKKWQKTISYAIVMLMSVGAFFIIFPQASDVMLHSFRGKETLSQLDNIADYKRWLQALIFGAEIQVTNVLSFHFAQLNGLYMALAVGIILVIGVMRERQWEMLSLLFIFGFSSWAVAFLAPKMFVFELRYFMPLSPLFAVLVVYAFYQIGLMLHFSGRYLNIFMALLILLNSVNAQFPKHSAFAFQNNEFATSMTQSLKGKNILVCAPYSVALSVTEFYLDADKVMFADGICSPLASFAEADYILLYQSVRQQLTVKPRPSFKLDNSLFADFKYIGTLTPGSSWIFDLYQRQN
ncbi:hypothetical protein IJ556_02605 [bacterium]|nr:hypothetical protein [bacterium]MBR2273216.1 hypothetical protein [Alphaproteobacteria bacterium]